MAPVSTIPSRLGSEQLSLLHFLGWGSKCPFCFGARDLNLSFNQQRVLFRLSVSNPVKKLKLKAATHFFPTFLRVILPLIYLNDFLRIAVIKSWVAAYSKETWNSERRLNQAQLRKSGEQVVHNGPLLIPCTGSWSAGWSCMGFF